MLATFLLHSPAGLSPPRPMEGTVRGVQRTERAARTTAILIQLYISAKKMNLAVSQPELSPSQ